MKKPEDTEDKKKWIKYGEEKEREFINKIAPKLDMDARINPKKKNEPTTIDMIVDGRLTDLKYKNEPFYLSKKIYGIEPENCITFDTIDYRRYCHYDNLDVIFWVDWNKKRNYGVTVQEVKGVWKMNFEKIKINIENKCYPKHKYKKRKNDPINSQSSYLLDLEDMVCIKNFKEKETLDFFI